MRDIKFRRPHYKSNGKFSHFSYWGCIDQKGNIVFDNSCFASPSSCNFAPETRTDEQFTGLKDKNGNDIYEGDRLQMFFHDGKKAGVPFPVEWDKRCARFTQWSPINNCEVVGNIHEGCKND